MAVWRLPYVLAVLSSSQVTMRRTDVGELFCCQPLVAVEAVDGKNIVRTIGGDAISLIGGAGYAVVNPFSTLEPLFSELDYAVAILAHGMRQLFRRPTLTAPDVAIRLEGRHSPLSENEIARCADLAERIGARMVHIFLDQSPLPDVKTINRRALSAADYVASPLKYRR